MQPSWSVAREDFYESESLQILLNKLNMKREISLKQAFDIFFRAQQISDANKS